MGFLLPNNVAGSPCWMWIVADRAALTVVAVQFEKSVPRWT
jgi:hypothetical protein